MMTTFNMFFIAIITLTLVIILGNFFARQKFNTIKAKVREDIYPLY